MNEWKLIRIICLLLCAGVLSACATYTRIDSKHWVPFEENLSGKPISYSVPGGFVAVDPIGWKDAVPVRSFHYDVLRSPYIYGSAWGETSIDFFVWESGEALENVATAVPSVGAPRPQPVERTTFRAGWHRTIFESEAQGWMSRWYVTTLSQGKYLLVRASLHHAVYQRSHLRAQRIQLAEDVVRTIQIKE